MLGKMIPVLCAALFFGCVSSAGWAKDQGINVAFPQGLNDADNTVMKGAIQILVIRCPDIVHHADALTGIRASFLPTYVAENSGLAKSRNWGRMVELEATVKGDAQLPKGWRGWNHTLSWRMGGGEKPGIFIIKPEAAQFCGRTGGDVLIDAPLSFIK